MGESERVCPLHIYSGLVPSIPQGQQLFGYLNSNTVVLTALQWVQLMNILIHPKLAVMHSIFIWVQAVTCKYLKINIKFSCLGNKYFKIFFLKKEDIWDTKNNDLQSNWQWHIFENSIPVPY